MADDVDIIKGCIREDRASQDKLYDTYASTMYGLCLRYSSTRDEAKDVLQDGFIKVFKSIGKFKNQGSLEGWIKRIMVNTALDQYHKRQKELNHASFDDINELTIEPAEVSIQNEGEISEDELMAMIQDLPRGYQMVFNLFAMEEYSHKQIAEMLNISESTSKTQLFKARSLLQKKIIELQRKNVLAI
jgi:RNA polymerase sigma-70 factor (ECF subfamily)